MDTFDNPSEILSSSEILLCFIKRTHGGNGESFIKDYVNQWLKLSGLIENHEFRNLLNRLLKLKHVVSLYELIEGQVANLTIDYSHEIHKEELTLKQREKIENLIDFETKQPATIVNGKIVKFSAEGFVTALKRFIYRLFVNQAFEAYKFVIDQIEYHKQVVSSREQQIQSQLNNPEATGLPTPGSQLQGGSFSLIRSIIIKT
ncbi:e3 ubiquitin-protein ligase [Gigaspora margarita]|uniref:E3 ubiquitin-protein ligase n=1 Tax=Gigaspora margarita TaxID=4874 RepID=A0A8H4B0L2_GIGMA|nr:e3 ubiquitin-protein ligase [Gigaspora margarita]